MSELLRPFKTIYRLPDSRYSRVEIHHWKRGDINIWNVYAYIWPGHALFKRYLRVKNAWKIDSAGLHGGCTYLRKHYSKERKVSCIEYGSDYVHYMDDRFEAADSIDAAWEVVSDARELMRYLDSFCEASS